MKDNKIIKLVVAFSIFFAIRLIGIDHIPPTAIVGIFLACIIYFMWSIFRVKKEKRKSKYYIIFAINLITLSMFSIMFYLTNDVFIVHHILIPITFGLFISTFISIIVWSITSNKK